MDNSADDDRDVSDIDVDDDKHNPCIANRPFTNKENKYIRTFFNCASQTHRSAVAHWMDLICTIVDKRQKNTQACILNVSWRIIELQSPANSGIDSESHHPPKGLEFMQYAEASAYALGLSLQMNFMIDHKQLWGVRMLGTYVGAEVPMPPPEDIMIQNTSIEIVDLWAPHQYMDDSGLSEIHIRTIFPSFPQPLSELHTVIWSVHCEYTLVKMIVNDLNPQRTPSFILLYVGMTKSLCNLGTVFINLIKRWHPNLTIIVPTHHFMNVVGWTLPPLLPLEISRAVDDHIQSSITGIRSKAFQECCLNSPP
ncbi:hypothetical protein BDD12DRAFT_802283 [Trichophaea hybrida]|nr:hypothetical protein BDD12DRAFT_802283 [Trichophaea hybrida]